MGSTARAACQQGLDWVADCTALDHMRAEQGGVCAATLSWCTWINPRVGGGEEDRDQLHKFREQAHCLQQISPDSAGSLIC